MKWPNEIILIRHAESSYNDRRWIMDNNKTYKKLKVSFDQDPFSLKTKILALLVKKECALDVGDWNTPLSNKGYKNSYELGQNLRKNSYELPNTIFVSPYLRTVVTMNRVLSGYYNVTDGGEKIAEDNGVKIVREERIREQEHGLANIYNNWRVFYALHSDQKRLYDLEGSYWYQYPQGENVPMVRERNKSWLGTLIREYSEDRVWGFTHHLNILAFRAEMERWDDQKFINLDEGNKPRNLSLTVYRGDPTLGKEGRMVLDRYNYLLTE